MPVDASLYNSSIGLATGAPHDETGAHTLEGGVNLGAALRAMRESQGLSLDRLALATRVKPQYLAAIEAMRLESLPSRPFTVGYVRAYAAALGADPDQAVARFKRDAPEGDQKLAAPVGVDRGSDPNLKLVIVLGVLVVLAIVIWNVAQHLPHAQTPVHNASAADTAALAAASANRPAGPVKLGPSLPPPPESTVPEPYVTPGLAGASGAAAPVAATQTLPIGTPFAAKGAVYGSPAAHAAVILLAQKPVSLVVRGQDGSVYFARELETGEAYAAPTLGGLSAEVSNPAMVSVYVGHALKGAFPAGGKADLSGFLAPASP
jgi:cytoskeleton protein RodZ